MDDISIFSGRNASWLIGKKETGQWPVVPVLRLVEWLEEEEEEEEEEGKR